jgi:hypothetical protein
VVRLGWHRWRVTLLGKFNRRRQRTRSTSRLLKRKRPATVTAVLGRCRISLPSWWSSGGDERGPAGSWDGQLAAVAVLRVADAGIARSQFDLHTLILRKWRLGQDGTPSASLTSMRGNSGSGLPSWSSRAPSWAASRRGLPARPRAVAEGWHGRRGDHRTVGATPRRRARRTSVDAPTGERLVGGSAMTATTPSQQSGWMAAAAQPPPGHNRVQHYVLKTARRGASLRRGV